MPRFDFLIGPPGSNEVTKLLAEWVGAKVLNFTDFFWEHFINQHKDDEYITQQLIEYIQNHRARRILIEEFPQNKQQAKHFLEHSSPPDHIFFFVSSF